MLSTSLSQQSHLQLLRFESMLSPQSFRHKILVKESTRLSNCSVRSRYQRGPQHLWKAKRQSWRQAWVQNVHVSRMRCSRKGEALSRQAGAEKEGFHKKQMNLRSKCKMWKSGPLILESRICYLYSESSIWNVESGILNLAAAVLNLESAMMNLECRI